MTRYRLPCIVCESGDPYSNIVCEDCEARIEHRKEVYEAMCELVHDLNDLTGSFKCDLPRQVQDQVKPIYDMLCAIKIKDTRIKDEKDE